MPLAVHQALSVVPLAIKAARTALSSSSEAGMVSVIVCLMWCMWSHIHQMWCFAMPDWSQVEIVATLREAMKKRSVKLTDLSRLTGVPYRSLQNYFSRRTEMPALVYLKLCAQLGLDPFYVKEGSFKVEYLPLRRALLDTVGHQLPTHDFLEDRSMTLVPYSGPERSSQELWKDAGTVAHFVARAYDHERERQLQEPLNEENEDEGSPNGTPIDEPKR